jgi:RNA polymerase sigma factor (sigma-70 family)
MTRLVPQPQPSPSPNSPSVFVVDDDDSVRRSLHRLLSLAGFRVETFASPHDLLARLPYHGDGCIVTDLRMPQMSGLALQQSALTQGCILPFVFITGHGDVPDAVAAMKGGALDFLEKPLDPQTLLKAIERAIIAGRSARRLHEERDAARSLLATLTPRERQVCDMVGKGLLNKQIAAALGTSEKTVKAQRGKATRKLKVESTAALLDLLRNAAE